MRRIRLAIVLLAIVVAAFTAITLVALEGRDVVVLRTFDAQGKPRDTRTWIAQEDGALWVEAANTSRPFLLHILANPQVELRGDSVQQCRGFVANNPAGHLRIRRLLAAKYGWADRWIGLLADTSGSLAIRLECP